MNAILLHSYVTMYKNDVHNSKCVVGLFHEYHVSCMLEKNNFLTVRCFFCTHLFPFLFFLFDLRSRRCRPSGRRGRIRINNSLVICGWVCKGVRIPPPHTYTHIGATPLLCAGSGAVGYSPYRSDRPRPMSVISFMLPCET